MNEKRFILFLIALPGILIALSCASSNGIQADEEDNPPWVVYEGTDGPGNGQHVVLISGDEEYRSEEALPQLGKILARRHGFTCTVLFAINPDTGRIKPDYNKNIPGTHKLKTADLMIIFTRFRQLPDNQIKPIDRFLKSGKPVIGMRTATHAFRYPKSSKWHHYSFDYNGTKSAWKGGFGKLVLGETWVTHHGKHGSQSTRGIIPDKSEDHPITNRVHDGDIWGPTDVYAVNRPLPGDSKPLVLGQVLNGMKPDSKPVKGKKNNPMMPVAWTKSYQLPDGKKGDVFTTTMGASQDLKSEGLRRLLVNSVYHLLDMKVPDQANVDTVGSFETTEFGFGNFRKGLSPNDFRMNSNHK